jgi:hypothetical protein
MVSGAITNSMYTYVNLGQFGNDSDLFLSDKQALVEEWQNKMGYWFKLTQVDYPDTLTNGVVCPITFAVRNDGVAPIYVNWHQKAEPVTYVRLALLDHTNAVIAQTGDLAGINPFNWKPGQVVQNSSTFLFAGTTGAATLAIGVFSSDSLVNPDIKFANTGRLANGWYPIGAVTIGPQPRPRLSIAPESDQAGRIELSWPGVTGVEYGVYKTTNLLAGWPAQPLTNNISGNGATMSFSEPIGALSAAYYRLKAIGN